MEIKRADVKTYADFKKKYRDTSILILPIKRIWFDKILLGEKLEEYRNLTPYYKKRLEKYRCKDSFFCGFRAGYRMDSPFIICQCKLRNGEGLEKWGAEKGVRYYVLEIKKVSNDF